MVQSNIYFGCGLRSTKFDSRLDGIWGWFIIFHVKMVKTIESILGLGMVNSFVGLQGLESKKIMQMCKVCHLKFLRKVRFHTF